MQSNRKNVISDQKKLTFLHVLLYGSMAPDANRHARADMDPAQGHLGLTNVPLRHKRRARRLRLADGSRRETQARQRRRKALAAIRWRGLLLLSPTLLRNRASRLAWPKFG